MAHKHTIGPGSFIYRLAGDVYAECLMCGAVAHIESQAAQAVWEHYKEKAWTLDLRLRQKECFTGQEPGKPLSGSGETKPIVREVPLSR